MKLRIACNSNGRRAEMQVILNSNKQAALSGSNPNKNHLNLRLLGGNSVRFSLHKRAKRTLDPSKAPHVRKSLNSVWCDLSLFVQRVCPPLVGLAATVNVVLAPVPTLAADLNINGVSDYASDEDIEQVTSITQFSDVYPTDWAYQALANLIERYGCVAGYPNGSFSGNRAMTRYEAAALLNSCLDSVTELTDDLARLIKEFERELAIIRGRVDGLEARVGELESTQFSTTTKLDGQATFVVNGNAFKGSAGGVVSNQNNRLGAANLLFDLELNLETSFSGKDQLNTTLRAANFSDDNSLNGTPSTSSALDSAFSANASGEPILAIDKIFYTFTPATGVTVTVGPNVGQDDMLAVWPSVYATTPILNVTTMGGAPMAYNQNQGAGAGLSWQSANGFSVSANYVAINGNRGDARGGGIATAHAGGTGTFQVAYQNSAWTLAATYSGMQNDEGLFPYGTPLVVDSLQENRGFTHALGLGGSWQPLESGWLPSVSAGWGINSTRYDGNGETKGLVESSQSWTIGLQWQDIDSSGQSAGMAVGQPVFATSLYGGSTPEDGNYVWEFWYQLQLSDGISVTPAFFFLSRPLGQQTPTGRTVQQLGALVLTTLTF